MIKRILLGVGLLVAVFILGIVALAGYAASRPSEFRISRNTSISAPPAVVFAQVDNLHKWQDWSPWAKMDPNAKLTYSGPDAGTGASYSWSGNDKVGEGTMTITESRPNDLIRFKLDFIKPFQGTNAVEFTFEPREDQTVVTWTMSGHSNFLMKVIGIFMDCDKMLGPVFEKGLETLKSVSENAAKRQ
ncbi:SRPBCC family protein [soil metagenome]